MKVTVEYQIYIVVDSFGHACTQVVGESGEIAQIFATGKTGERLYFESEAYHLKAWCAENDLEFYLIERKEEIGVNENE